MAVWPKAPLTAYVASTTPAIKAADLNAFQTEFNTLRNGNYQAYPIVLNDDPLRIYGDQLGNNRTLIDKFGYRMGRVNEISECWANDLDTTGDGLTGQRSFQIPWDWDVNNTSTNAFINNIMSNDLGCRVMQFEPGSAAPDHAYLRSADLISYQAFHSIVMEWEMAFGAINQKGVYYVGLADSTALSSGVWIGKDTNVDNKIRVQAANGGTSSLATIVAVANTYHKCRIELHGANSPHGAVARFGVDGTMYSRTSNLPSINQVLSMVIHTEGLSFLAPTLKVSPIRLTWNRWLSAAAI